MESFIDYYAILEVPPDASTEDIKKAFRVGALKFHPDYNKSSDAAARFIDLHKAYNVLNDPEEKKTYDVLYKLYMQELSDKNSTRPSSRYQTETSDNGSSKPKRDPIYIILKLEKGRFVRFVLENIPYSLTSEQVDALVQDGMIRVQSSERNEYLFMYCVHCHALFISKRNRDKIGLLYFPYDLFPLCPHCDALNWCPADDIREKRKREAEEQREQVARERLKRWKEQNRQEEAARAREEVAKREEERRKAEMQRKAWEQLRHKASAETREEVAKREEERRKEVVQRKARERENIIKRRVSGIALVLVLVLFLGIILFFAYGKVSAQPPTITNLRLANPNLVAGDTAEVSFNYQPGNVPGYIEAQFSTSRSGVFDAKDLDTKDMKAGSQEVSFMSSPAGNDTVSFFWCPHYACSQAQPMGSLGFTLSSFH
jgi:curved DNA-binding protein CbpA